MNHLKEKQRGCSEFESDSTHGDSLVCSNEVSLGYDSRYDRVFLAWKFLRLDNERYDYGNDKKSFLRMKQPNSGNINRRVSVTRWRSIMEHSPAILENTDICYKRDRKNATFNAPNT